MTTFQAFGYDNLTVPAPAGGVSTAAGMAAVMQALHDVSLLLGRGEDGVTCRGSDLSWVYTGRRGLNRVVMRSAVTPTRAAARISDVLACFDRWSAPVTWVARTDLVTPALDAALLDAGFRPAATNIGVVLDLTSVDPASRLPQGSAGVRFAEARTAADLSAWAHVHEGDGVFDAIGDAADAFHALAFGGSRRCRFYTAADTAGSSPVARLLTYTNGATVGLYWLAARPDCRGRGLEMTLAARALDDARRAGAKRAVTSARPTDEPLWLGAGFTRQCQFKTYRWTPAGC